MRGLYLYLYQRPGQMVNIVFRAKRPRAHAHRSFWEGPQRPMNIRCTMQPWPHRHVERLIEDAADLRCRQRRAAEAQRANVTRQVAVAEDLVTVDLVQPPPQPFDQRHLM